MIHWDYGSSAETVVVVVVNHESTDYSEAFELRSTLRFVTERPTRTPRPWYRDKRAMFSEMAIFKWRRWEDCLSAPSWWRPYMPEAAYLPQGRSIAYCPMPPMPKVYTAPSTRQRIAAKRRSFIHKIRKEARP